MNSKVIIGLVLVVVAVLFFKFRGGGSGDGGYVIPWQPVTYAYKEYKGKPHIDTPAFYEVVKQKNAQGMCRVLYTQYKDTPDSEVTILAEKGDRDAQVEIIGRNLGNNYFDFEPVRRVNAIKYIENHGNSVVLSIYNASLLSRPAAMKQLVSGVKLDEDKLLRIEKFAGTTPFAIFSKYLSLTIVYDQTVNLEVKRMLLDEATRLKQAGGYYFGLGIAAKTELELTGKTDKDTFCEAYYNGCDLYELKQRYGISCE